MAAIEDHHIYGLTIRESATDGSDFTNPDADYRRLFLGEDGLLHLKDSAGTVTDIGGGSGDVATDPIWDVAGDLAVGTGADTAARLAKGAAGAYLSTYNGTVAWNGGTSFPASPATGDRYWRSDLGLEFYYDGTRWLSTNLFTETFAVSDALQPASASGTFGRWAGWGSTYSLWLVELRTWWYNTGTNNGSNYWTFALQDDAANTIASLNTSAGAGSTNTYTITTIGSATGTTKKQLLMSFSKTGAPGNTYSISTLVYRLIGT